MTDLLLSSTWFGFVLSTGTFWLTKALNRRWGRERLNPLLFATVVCGLVIVLSGMDYEVYYQGAQYLEVLLTPATICLAIPLYRQFELLRKNIPAVAAGCMAGVAAHMAGCVVMLAVFHLESPELSPSCPSPSPPPSARTSARSWGATPPSPWPPSCSPASSAR